jgi:hypothetical protein
LSYYTVGSCYTTLDITSSYELSPLFACPNAHTLQLTLRDSNGAVLPLPRIRDLPQPALTVSAPPTLNYTLSWTRPTGTVRSDTLDMTVTGIGLLPAQQPLRNFSTPRDFSRNFTTAIDPAKPGTSYALELSHPKHETQIKVGFHPLTFLVAVPLPGKDLNIL